MRALCERFPDSYWGELDASQTLPGGVCHALTRAGWLAALIPLADYGGSGFGSHGSIGDFGGNKSLGGNSGACHAQMYVMGTLLRHGFES